MFFFKKLPASHELSLLDLAEIRSSYLALSPTSPNIYLDSNKFPALVALQNLYPIFNPTFSIFTIPPQLDWPIHFDHGRSSALNIPLFNCTSDSLTRFYNNPDPHINTLEPNESYQITLVKGPLFELTSFSLTSASLISTSIPHSVANLGELPRVIFSWGSMLSIESLIDSLP
tara:strand:+ start:1700 stop:2218 length:519 start_codon:yes stop_codon:yes gene_type:complete